MIGAYTYNCARNINGNSYVLITEVLNIESVTVSGGEVTAIIMDVGKAFQKVEARQDTITRNEIADKNMIDVYEHIIDFTISRMTLESNVLTESIKDASACGIASVVMDNNGKGWLVGWNYTEEYQRALFLKDYIYQSAVNQVANPLVDFNLYSRSECRDLPFNDALNAYITNNLATGITELDFVDPGSISYPGEGEISYPGEGVIIYP